MVTQHDDPLVSVVMAVHNATLLELKQSCNSILAQTYTKIQFVIIDDGNNHAICKYLEELELQHPCVFLIKNPINIGLTRSLIKGIDICEGVYIARQDADDYSSYDRIAEQVNHLQKNQEICLLGTAYILEDVALGRKKFQSHSLQHDAIIQDLYSINPLCHTSVMFTKQQYIQAGGYDKKFRTSQDFDLWFRMAKVGRVENLPCALVTRRLTNNSLSSNISRAFEQINNGARVRLREKAMYKGKLFYLNVFYIYIRSLIIMFYVQIILKLILKK